MIDSEILFRTHYGSKYLFFINVGAANVLKKKNTTIPLNPCRGEILSFYNPSTSKITELTISLFNIFVNFTEFLFG